MVSEGPNTPRRQEKASESGAGRDMCIGHRHDIKYNRMHARRGEERLSIALPGTLREEGTVA